MYDEPRKVNCVISGVYFFFDRRLLANGCGAACPVLIRKKKKKKEEENRWTQNRPQKGTLKTSPKASKKLRRDLSGKKRGRREEREREENKYDCGSRITIEHERPQNKCIPKCEIVDLEQCLNAQKRRSVVKCNLFCCTPARYQADLSAPPNSA